MNYPPTPPPKGSRDWDSRSSLAGEDDGGNTKLFNIDFSHIELSATDLYDKEKTGDIETLSLEAVYQLLKTDGEGLSNAEAARRLEIFGPNALVSEPPNPIFQFLSFLWNPLSWVMEGAAVVAIALSNGFGKPPDWPDFLGIVLLLLINATIGFLEERSAGNAVKALMDSLAPKAKVRRDGQWKEVESSVLVPGDLVAFKIGDIVPADCRLTEALNVSIDQAALTGESLPVSKKLGDQCFSGSTCKQGEAEGVVIATGQNTFFGRAASLVGTDADEIGHLQQVLANIGLFCMVAIGIFVIAEMIILFGAYHYPYRRGLDDLLVLLIGGIPIAMPTVLSVTLAIGAQQLAKHKAIVTRITAIEELAGVTILCSDKTGTLTTNKLTIDKDLVIIFGSFNAEEVMILAAYASRTENSDAIDTCVVSSVAPGQARAGIEILDFKPFDPVTKRTEATYRELATGKVKRVTKGMTSIIAKLCTRTSSDEIERLEDEVDGFARRGLRALAVAHEDVTGSAPDGPGNGFALIGLLAIFDPPRADTKQTIEDAQALGVKVKMVTGDQLEIAMETGRRLGLGDHMYPSKVIVDGSPEKDGRPISLDELIMQADGFAGVYPEHKYEIVKRIQNQGHLVAMTGDGANDAPALARANVGIAVEGATDAANAAADLVLTEPGLSTIIHAIRGSRIIFQRMRNYAIYACSVTIRIVVGFAFLAFIYQSDFPPFMVLIIAVLNDGSIMTLSADRALPSATPDEWYLPEIFAFAMTYGVYLSLSTLIFVYLVLDTQFFESTFGVPVIEDANDPHLHMILYLQVAIISQALIFVTRSHGWSFLERPSTMLMLAFVAAQVISSLIAAFATMPFTNVAAVSGGWIAIVWVWNIVLYFPMDLVKFATRWTIINPMKARRNAQRALLAAREERRANNRLSTVSSLHESLYAPRMNVFKRAGRRLGLGKGRTLEMSAREQRRFSSMGAARASIVLERAAS